MPIRKLIKQVLREQRERRNKSWSKETKALKGADKSRQKFIEVVLKKRHNFIKTYNQRQREENPEHEGYSDDYDEFILGLKNGFPTYSGFGHMVQTTLNPTVDNPLLMGADIPYLVKLMAEYVLNYGEETHERVDVVNESDLVDYVNEQFFTCDKKFFEVIWDDVLSGRRNYWNEDVKERMWNELQPEIEERMDDEEWQEEWGINFESIDREEGYFMSYWHYPLQNLGWDEMQLCDYYREYLDPQDFVTYFFPDGKRSDDTNKIWSRLRGVGNDTVYIIHRNRLFDW